VLPAEFLFFVAVDGIAFAVTGSGFPTHYLPGFIASSPDRPTTEQPIYDAFQLHIGGLKEKKKRFPPVLQKAKFLVLPQKCNTGNE
jgi:hypothetical protein